MEWTTVQVLGVIVGLFVSVGAPIIKLNSTIIKLNTNVESMDRRFGQFEMDNKDSHTRIWKKNTEQDEVLNDHETRITVLERDR